MLGCRASHVSNRVSADVALYRYLDAILTVLGSEAVMIPPVPPLTRYKREVAVKQVSFLLLLLLLLNPASICGARCSVRMYLVQGATSTCVCCNVPVGISSLPVRPQDMVALSGLWEVID